MCATLRVLLASTIRLCAAEEAQDMLSEACQELVQECGFKPSIEWHLAMHILHFMEL